MSEEFSFKKATKAAARLRLALCGPAGSGKTYTALLLAKHLGGRVAVIDTERGSASKYADEFDFDALDLAEPFAPQRYVEAIHAAEQAGFDSVLIDSLSHAWIGPGGGLSMHDEALARQKVKNAFTAWAEVTPHHNALVQALLQSRCHVIATMRTKTEYVQEKDERTGKTQVRKVGMAPLMRDGIEYEFDVTGDLDLDNTLVVGKTRCKALKGKVYKQPGKELADSLAAWLGGPPASAPAAVAPPAPPGGSPAISHAEADALALELDKLGLAEEDYCARRKLPGLGHLPAKHLDACRKQLAELAEVVHLCREHGQQAPALLDLTPARRKELLAGLKRQGTAVSA